MGSGSDTSDDEFSLPQFRTFTTAQAQAISCDQTQIRKVPMPDMTFPIEYTGDVDYLENRANDDCDYLTTLVIADPSHRLVIYKWRQ
jgi:hypothetical protein